MTEWFIYFPPMSVKPQIIGKEIQSSTQFLRFCYQTIGCSSIETVRFSSPTDVLIVDEEGLLKDNYQINMVGSALTKSLIVGGMIIAQHGARDGEPDLVGYSTMDEAAIVADIANTLAQLRYDRLFRKEVLRMADVIEIQLTDKFVQDYWFGELDHDDTEVPRFQDVMDWIADNHPAAIFIADRIYAHVKSLYFPG